MILYFDKYFILKEIINDKKIYQGGFNNQSIYVYVENCPNVAQTFIRYELFGATDENERNIITNEIEGNDIIVSKIPFDRQRDLKFFNYHDDYTFFVFNLPNGTDGNYNVLAFSGLINATIRLVTSNEVIQPLGLISFNVERSVIAEDIGISQSQYDYMITKFFGERSEILSNANLDTFFTNGIYVLNGNKVVNSPVDNPYGLLVVYSNKDYVVHNLTLENGDFYSRIGNNNNGIIDWNDWHNVDDDLSEKLDKYGGEGAELSLSDSNFYDCRICGETIIEGGIVNVGESVIDFTGGHIYADKATEENEVVNLKQLDEENEKLQKRIKQLELASEGTILSTYENVSEVSYNRLIGENVLPYGTLDKVGGMTYKSENLAVWDSSNVKTRNVDISYTINENGTITLNGTNTTDGGSIIITLKESLSAGTYRVALFNKAITDGATNNAVLINGSWSYALGLNAENYSASLTITETITQIVIRINNTTVFENYTIKPMIVSGTTAPSEYSKGFDGLRNTAVSEVISNGANLLNIDDFTTTKNGITYTYSKGHFTAKGTFEGVHRYNNVYFNSNQMHMTGKTKLYANKTYVLSISNAVSRMISMAQSGVAGTGNIAVGQTTKVFTNTKDIALNVIQIGGNTEEEIGTSVDIECDIWVNEVEAKPYTPYKEPIHYAVPPEVQALQGYGIGINETYKNYIDYERKMFVNACNVVMLKDLSWRKSSITDIDRFVGDIPRDKLAVYSNAPIICNFKNISYGGTYGGTNKNYMWLNVGTEIAINIGDYGTTTLEDFKAILNEENPILIYPLATPIETDISQYLTQDNVIELEALGSLTFENEHKQAVPNEISYQERNV